MEMKLDKDKNVVLTTNGITISLDLKTIELLQCFVDREVYFRDDVMLFLKKQVEFGRIPEEAISEERAISAVINDYADRRYKQYRDLGNRLECVSCAYLENPYFELLRSLNSKNVGERIAEQEEMGYTVTEIGVAIKGHETDYHIMAEGAPHEGKAEGEVNDG